MARGFFFLPPKYYDVKVKMTSEPLDINFMLWGIKNIIVTTWQEVNNPTFLLGHFDLIRQLISLIIVQQRLLEDGGVVTIKKLLVRIKGMISIYLVQSAAEICNCWQGSKHYHTTYLCVCVCVCICVYVK